MNEKELREFRDRLNYVFRLVMRKVVNAPFYRPKKNSKEFKYLIDCRKSVEWICARKKRKYRPY